MLDVKLIHQGDLCHPLAINLVLVMSARPTPDGGAWLTLEVIERLEDDALVERNLRGALSPSAWRCLLERLAATGLPEREPELRLLPDSSDYFGQFDLTVTLHGRSHLTTMPFASSGFGGVDAPAVKAFLGRLLDLAAVTEPRTRGDLT